MSKPKYFQIFIDKKKLINLLSDEEAGRLFKAIFAFADKGEIADFSDNRAVNMAYMILTEQIERDYETYEHVCKVNKRNAKKDLKKATASDRIQEEEKEEEKEKDKEKDKHSMDFGGEAAGECSDEFCFQVFETYNNICFELPQVRKLTDKRRRLIANADRLLKELGVDSFKEYFYKVTGSGFLCGYEGNWKGCNFDWLLEENNLVRVAEGVFDNGRDEKQPERSYDLGEIDRINTLDRIT
ncbi:MAG: DUF6291 domain-containing protein [Ruminococcus sp.]|nr:DUF6291 domain-containing protein [Ruminococcus sp.]